MAIKLADGGFVSYPYTEDLLISTEDLSFASPFFFAQDIKSTR